MSGRLTDEQIARILNGETAYPWWEPLATEVQSYRALRPKCPTCDGTGSVEGRNIACVDGCWDCEDGRMPLADWMKLLVEDSEQLARAMRHPDACPASYGPMHRCDCGTRNVLAAHAAVLKMAGDQ